MAQGNGFKARASVTGVMIELNLTRKGALDMLTGLAKLRRLELAQPSPVLTTEERSATGELEHALQLVESLGEHSDLV
jgi:hypothetical protein